MRARHGQTPHLPRPGSPRETPVAVITGAGRGLGQAIARRLHRDGYQLVLGDVDGPRVRAAAAELGHQHTAVEADVTDLGASDDMATAAMERHGRLDVWVNNAGVMPLGRLHSQAPDVLAYTCEVNLGGVVRGSLAALEHMRPQGSGHIVNIASITAVKPLAGFAVYGATKAAVVSFSQSLRRELRHDSIHVTAVLPYMITTAMTPGIEPRLLCPLEPAHVAEAVARAITKPRACIYVPRTSRFLSWAAGLPQRVQDITDNALRMDDVASGAGTRARTDYDAELSARTTTACISGGRPAPTEAGQ
ncbi:SDR family oxidoreductase [Streptomyces sp. NBC_01408]|uniref:SDR family NAD(P)-dependent oxidoreductase n=1 Tax=Streptomyces sp. NBC_01408 TaxID=2903855 RepID=UPI00225AD15B|nr:SDR family NAD(P)-dependent oxidoreductase [Streptomyces sp. NBC_01408]MCX4695618.1 SDR family NAD(P)-dependent oxidoreductase [Streptomyces sp. NBC_01408]